MRFGASGRSRVIAPRPIAPSDPFRALRFGGPQAVKVVVFGQDPYRQQGHADGMAFSAGQVKPASAPHLPGSGRGSTRFSAPRRMEAGRVGATVGVLLLNPTPSIEVGCIGSHR